MNYTRSQVERLLESLLKEYPTIGSDTTTRAQDFASREGIRAYRDAFAAYREYEELLEILATFDEEDG